MLGSSDSRQRFTRCVVAAWALRVSWRVPTASTIVWKQQQHRVWLVVRSSPYTDQNFTSRQLLYARNGLDDQAVLPRGACYDLKACPDS